MPDFTCSLNQPAKHFEHYWEHTVGSGHAPLALRADWQAQMRRCHNELGFRHVRFHALLSDEMFTLTCQEEQLLYSFRNADQIIDFLLSIGMKPFVELSFMPETLASGNTTVFSYRGNVTPPKDYDQWATLIQKIVGHWVDRYGVKEVREWFFEVWNEPNLKAFWTGTQEEYFKLYQRTAAAIKAVEPTLKVGGPATADNSWIQEFLDFCNNEFSSRRFRQHPSLPHRCFWLAGRRYDHPAGACAARYHARRGSQVSRRSARPAALLHGMEHLLESARSDARRAFRRRLCDKNRHGSARPGAGLQFLDLQRYLFGKLLSVRSFSWRLRNSKPSRNRQAVLQGVPVAP